MADRGALAWRHRQQGEGQSRLDQRAKWSNAREDSAPFLQHVDGILVPAGFGQRGAEGKIRAARFADERARALTSASASVCRWPWWKQPAISTASRSKFDRVRRDERAGCRFDDRMDAWQRAGTTQNRRRSWRYDAAWRIQSGSQARQQDFSIYDGDTEISERHRHRYEVNARYKDRLEQHGMRFAGMSPDGLLPETIEYENIRGSSACNSIPN